MNTSITHNELKKGDMVELTAVSYISNAPRVAEIYDNLKGTTRTVKILNQNSYYPDIGSNYIDEIKFRLNNDGTKTPVELSTAHAKKLSHIRNIMNNWR
jgi:hypothetical protein